MVTKKYIVMQLPGCCSGVAKMLSVVFFLAHCYAVARVLWGVSWVLLVTRLLIGVA